MKMPMKSAKEVVSPRNTPADIVATIDEMASVMMAEAP